MKNAILAILLSLLASNAHAVSVYKQPAVKITYTEAYVTVVVTTMIRTNVIPYGTSDLLAVHITNNTAYDQDWNISINERSGLVSTQFTPDTGCDGPLLAHATCTVNVTFTPAAPSPDGLVVTDDEDFFIDRAGAVYKQYTIRGLSN